MIRVLHIIQHLSVGGAARAMSATAKYSTRQGDFLHSVFSILPADPKGIDLVGVNGLVYIGVADKTKFLHEIEQADIVHVHWWNNPEIYDFLRSELPEMRLLIWAHVAGDYAPQIITKELISFADFFVAGNPYTYEHPEIQNLPPEVLKSKTGMVHDAPDFERVANFRLKPHSTYNIGYIGTVDFVKMHPNYVPMSASIDLPNVRFIICGGGIEDSLRQQAQQLGAGERFEFRGYMSDIRPVLEILDVFGYPLCVETFVASELALQEVMHSGIPPVVFPHGGMKRLVEHDRTGLVVHSEREYKQAIEYLYHHPEERARLGRNAREFAQQVYGAENAARKLNPIYKRMMGLPKRKQIWGKIAGVSLLDQPVALEDLLGEPRKLLGAESFIDSLNTSGQDFLTSFTSLDIEELFTAEGAIASSSLLMCSVDSGGIIHYRNFHQNDGFLRLWTGLVLHKHGRYPEAAAEFNAAIKLGCNHWRLGWYLAQAAEKMGDQKIAEEAVRMVLQLAPDFCEAQTMLQRLTKPAQVTGVEIAPDDKEIPNATVTLEMLLSSDDLHAALQEHEDKLDINLLALVQANTATARADGDIELAEGLDNLAAYLEDVVGNKTRVSRHQQSSAIEILELLLNADDITLALRKHEDKFDANLLTLVRTNSIAAREDGFTDLVRRLDNITTYAESVVDKRLSSSDSSSLYGSKKTKTPIQKINEDQFAYSKKGPMNSIFHFSIDAYSPVILSLATFVNMASSLQTWDEILLFHHELATDEYIDYVDKFYRESIRRFGKDWFYLDIVNVVYTAAKLLQPMNYLEIGIRRGRSLCVAARGCPTIDIHGFDMWVPNYAGMENPGPDFVRAELVKHHHQGTSTFINGDSHRTIPEFFNKNPNMKFDLITVDGDHTEEGAFDDLCNVIPHLSVGGILIFDDISHPEHPYMQNVWHKALGIFSYMSGYEYTDLGFGVAMAIREAG